LSLLFVGTWSLQKGCDLLVSVMARTPGVRLVHVGSIGRDLAFPTDDPRFVHIDPVPQTELGRFYAKAGAFVLASRQDGLAVVLAQALASGLPIICTDRTGGADLAHTTTLADRIIVVPHDDAHALGTAISTVGAQWRAGLRLAPLSENDRNTLSWAAYGQRYNAELLRSFASQSHFSENEMRAPA
jgi:glycosyltransferase involved in cell wall biosynthesis